MLVRAWSKRLTALAQHNCCPWLAQQALRTGALPIAGNEDAAKTEVVDVFVLGFGTVDISALSN
ncbi:hypothetical protein V2J94_42050 [Streptomyces sp. DSM 41524]|uniref:Uncharacterized protein n=1 Tax=Streptomyces asiaticus subsp. ignotus TaxID=3098222 RepID=A0ABU7QCJ3_9ACTN|nr:hypothetical protein [Streptomyces sp. DSM 41524]